MDQNITAKIDSIVRALSELSYVPSEDQDSEYLNIITLMEHYIMKNCIHNKVYDSIDVHPEESKTICYCIHCHTTFPLIK